MGVVLVTIRVTFNRAFDPSLTERIESLLGAAVVPLGKSLGTAELSLTAEHVLAIEAALDPLWALPGSQVVIGGTVYHQRAIPLDRVKTDVLSTFWLSLMKERKLRVINSLRSYFREFATDEGFRTTRQDLRAMIQFLIGATTSLKARLYKQRQQHKQASALAKQARTTLQEALHLWGDPNFSNSCFVEIGITYEIQGQDAKARAQYQRIRQIAKAHGVDLASFDQYLTTFGLYADALQDRLGVAPEGEVDGAD